MLRKAGFCLHGLMHIGQGLVCGSKIQDMVDAGFHFTIFLADWHSMINNKFGGDLEKIRTTGRYFKHCFTSLGIPEDRVEYLWASDLAKEASYWERVLRVGKAVSMQRAMRALPIMGRDMRSTGGEAASIFYPCMQAADIFQMRLDVACAGLDQRKAHILAREAGEKLGWGKPVSLHTPLLMGLAGVKDAEKGSFDEDPKLSQVIAAKMSKSKPENNILIHDEPEVIEEKMRKAFCPPKVAEGNPVLQYFRLLVFGKPEDLVLKRREEFGGNLKLTSYRELEDAYVSGKIHAQDLKANMARMLSEKLKDVREYFKKHAEPLEEMRRLGAG